MAITRAAKRAVELADDEPWEVWEMGEGFEEVVNVWNREGKTEVEYIVISDSEDIVTIAGETGEAVPELDDESDTESVVSISEDQFVSALEHFGDVIEESEAITSESVLRTEKGAEGTNLLELDTQETRENTSNGNISGGETLGRDSSNTTEKGILERVAPSSELESDRREALRREEIRQKTLMRQVIVGTETRQTPRQDTIERLTKEKAGIHTQLLAVQTKQAPIGRQSLGTEAGKSDTIERIEKKLPETPNTTLVSAVTVRELPVDTTRKTPSERKDAGKAIAQRDSSKRPLRDVTSTLKTQRPLKAQKPNHPHNRPQIKPTKYFENGQIFLIALTWQPCSWVKRLIDRKTPCIHRNQNVQHSNTVQPFNIHGLWRDKICDLKQSKSPNPMIPGTRPINLTQLFHEYGYRDLDYFELMKNFWSGLICSAESHFEKSTHIWNHEFLKHGSSMDSGKPGEGNALNYSATTIQIWGKLKPQCALQHAGIVPTSTQRYYRDDIAEALEHSWGKRVFLESKAGSLSEVRYYFRIKGDSLNASIEPVDATTESRCDAIISYML